MIHFPQRALLALTAVAAISLVPIIAQAQTATTVRMPYSFYGPAGRYLIELFEVGAPYPSRQDWNLNGWYNGQFTYRETWTYISKGRSYFIRVTDVRTGVRKQSGSFHIPSGWGDYYNAPHFNWYNR